MLATRASARDTRISGGEEIFVSLCEAVAGPTRFDPRARHYLVQ